MSKLVWDKTSEHFYETGVDHVVLFKYVKGAPGTGVAWNGVTAINESPSGADPTPLYADNIKYLNLLSTEEFAASIEAYMYPDEFAECDGSAELATGVYIGQQSRSLFGLYYRTIIGNDTEGNDLGYKHHFIYNCLAAPSEKAYNTVNDSPDIPTMSWSVSTTPVEVTNHKPTASLVIDSTKVDATKLQTLLDKTIGTDDAEPELLMPDDIAAIFATTA